MKPLTFLVCLILSNLIMAQSDFTTAEIAESEAKSATSILNFRANANTGNYDLSYHRLEFTIDPSVPFIDGVVTSYFTATSDLSEIIFDMDDNLTVSEVTQDGNTLSFTQNANDELVITLPQVQNQGVLDSLTINYSGNPANTGFGSFVQDTHDGDPIIWTLSEPYGAKAWWPCKQDLIDKIDSIDVYITTPRFNPSNEEYIAVSNGIEQSQTINGNTKTTHYKHEFLIPAYLIAIAATNYEVYTEEVPNSGNPFDIVNYVFPEDLTEAQSSTPVTVAIMDLFIDLFEPYPFETEKYGHAQFTRNGGMEHTTVSFMGNYSRNLIAHELAHQWFGNKITCGSWQDIWLNEGFATYLSGLVIEDLDGNAAFTTWKQQRVNSITMADDGSVYVPAQDTTNVSRVFNGRLSYNKGSMVLHMLRKKLGDATFYQSIKDYLSDTDYAFDYVKTDEFINVIEQSSGEQLDEFFNDWVYNEGFPSYQIEWEQVTPTQLRIEVSQTQSHPSVDFFEAIVPIRVHGSGGEVVNLTLDHSSNGQEFFEVVNFDVVALEFDPEVDLISKDNTVSLSVTDFALEAEFMVFPNPATTTITIKKPAFVEVFSVDIYNMLGQLVMRAPYSENMHVEDLSSGLHFIRFETNTGIIHKRLLKK